jgi:acyl carrier protein
MEAVIRQILRDSGNLAVDAGLVSAEEDLYECGLTSHACVNVMLALEDEYDFEFPDYLLRMSTFQSVVSIIGALGEAGVDVSAAS